MESPDILMNSGLPVVTAFVLGLLTAISPCPLATNITAIGLISRDIGNRKRIFRNGLLYTLGRIITYTVLGLLVIPILREGASMFAIQKGISQWGEWIISPLLLLTGGFMLWGQRLNLPKFGFSGDNEKLQNLKGGVGSLTLGILFALAFCPTSGVFYFGLLIPMAAISTGGMWFPVVFAVATALPVAVVAWLLAYSIAGIGRFYNRLQVFERWMRRIVGWLFTGTGLYYLIRLLEKSEEGMKRQLIKTGITVTLPIVILIVLFALQDTFIRLGSTRMSRMQNETTAASIADSIQILYNYKNRCDTGLQYTFLEFGAMGCISCRKMERVMEDIRTTYGKRVKVRFMNVSKQETQEWTKYFGIAAIPTQIILDNNGHEIFRHTGFISAEDLGTVFK